MFTIFVCARAGDECAVADGSKIDVRFVNFQDVQELGIFVPGNMGDTEETILTKLVILGEPLQHTGVKRSAEEQASSTKGDWLGKGIS